MKAKQKPHYVNNKEFSLAVVDYVTSLNEAREAEIPLPKVTDYIARCLMKIAEGLSHKANFVRYTYRDEMVMDAVENCLKAIENYNLDAATRTGTPNAFAYFTQISWYAFLRRIEKEKRQQDIKMRYMNQAGIEDMIDNQTGDDASLANAQAYVDQLRIRIDEIKEKDAAWKEVVKKERKKRTVKADSDLTEFL